MFMAFQRRPKSTPKDHDPDCKTHRQQNLPKAPQIQVLPTLMADPKPSLGDPAFDASILSSETSNDDYRERHQKEKRENALVSGLFPRNQGRNENSRGHIGRGHPKD